MILPPDRRQRVEDLGPVGGLVLAHHPLTSPDALTGPLTIAVPGWAPFMVPSKAPPFTTWAGIRDSSWRTITISRAMSLASMSTSVSCSCFRPNGLKSCLQEFQLGQGGQTGLGQPSWALVLHVQQSAPKERELAPPHSPNHFSLGGKKQSPPRGLSKN